MKANVTPIYLSNVGRGPSGETWKRNRLPSRGGKSPCGSSFTKKNCGTNSGKNVGTRRINVETSVKVLNRSHIPIKKKIQGKGKHR